MGVWGDRTTETVYVVSWNQWRALGVYIHLNTL